MTLKNKSNKLFWNEINKLYPKHFNETNVLDNCVGSANITNLLKDKYQLLYNEYNEDNVVIHNKICNLISRQCMVDKCDCKHKISLKDVKDALKTVKGGKFDPIYLIFSDCIKNSTDEFFQHLCLIFNKMLIHGISSADFNKSVIISIVKDKRKSKSSSENYRGIS